MSWQERLASKHLWVLAGVTFIGFWLRVWGLDFGLPNDSRPDEIPIIEIVLNNLLTPLVDRGDLSLNPRFLYYPSLYLYVVTMLYGIFYSIAVAQGAVSGWQDFLLLWMNDGTPFFLILRAFSVLCGTVMIPAMYWLGRDLVNARVGLIAAALMAGSYLLVRNAHFGTVDTPMTLCIVLALWAVIRYNRLGEAQWLKWACVFVGLATGFKYPAALTGLAIWVVLLKPFWTSERIDWSGFVRTIWKPTLGSAAVFLLTSPWIVLEFNTFLDHFRYDAVYYFFQLPGVPSGWVFYPGFTLFYGAGGWVLLFGALGVWLAFRRQAWGDRWAHAALLTFLLSFYLLLGPNTRVMTRYTMPMIPVILAYAAIGVAYAASLIARVLNVPASGWRAALPLTGVLLVALYQPLHLSLSLDRLLGMPDTRSIARQWILANAQPGTIVATGPRLGQIRLPLDYGQLLLEAGPNNPRDTGDVPQIEIRPENPRIAVTNSYAQIKMFHELGVRYVVMYDGMPLFSNPGWELRAMAEQAPVAFHVPSTKRLYPDQLRLIDAEFDPMDAFFLPYHGFEAFERPGPNIYIFDVGAGKTS